MERKEIIKQKTEELTSLFNRHGGQIMSEGTQSGVRILKFTNKNDTYQKIYVIFPDGYTISTERNY